MTCPVCGDDFAPNPNHRACADCPECWAWSTPAPFTRAVSREPWRTAKRLRHNACMVKRGALREPAYFARPVDPRATIRVARLEVGR